MIRAVPETAVRILLGARARQSESGVVLNFEGHDVQVASDVYFKASEIARILSIRPREVKLITDVLELRHEAEDRFLESLSKAKDVPHILFVPAGEMASAWYRARLPAEILSDKGLAVANFTERLDLGKACRYDVLWVQLVTAPVLLQIVRKAKEEGIKIVYDVDDAFWCIPPDNPASEIYVRDKQDEVWEMIGLADMVTVSTSTLSAAIKDRSGHPDVRVLPNHILASISPTRAEGNPDVKRIAWAGSPTHRRDLAIAAPALRKVLERHKGKVRFTCFGERIPEALISVREWVDLVQFVDFSAYAEALAAIDADIGIAPLEPTEFNRFRSDVKALEYGASGMAVLASPVGQYPELADSGAYVGLVQDDQWEDSLESLLLNIQSTRKAGQDGRLWVHENRCLIRSRAKPWAEAAKDLVLKKVEVTS